MAALICKSLVNVGNKINVGGSGGSNFLVAFGETQYTGKFGTTWSYQTSNSPSSAGRDSDTFLVPNLSVIYSRVTTVGFANCSAWDKTDFQFDLASEVNKPAISFVTVYDVENHLMPNLDQITKRKKQEYLEAEGERKARLEETVAQLENGLNEWNRTMADYDATNTKKATELPTPQQWFSGWVASNDMFVKETKTVTFGSGVKQFDIGEPMPEDHWAAMLPKRMNDGAVMVDGFAALQESSGKVLGNLDHANRLEFSGGGSTMKYALAHHAIEKHVSMMGAPEVGDDSKRGTWDYRNSNGKINFDQGGHLDATIFSIKVGFDIAAGLRYTDAFKNQKTTNMETDTSISFLLGDGDANDFFVVKIFFASVIFTSINNVFISI